MEKRFRRSSLLSAEVPEKWTRDNGIEEKMSEIFQRFMKDTSSQIQKAQYIKCRH